MEAKKLGPGRPSIFGYHDYRDFLWDWIEFKYHSEGMSIRSLCKRAGFSSGFLPQILHRKRNLTAGAFEKLVPHLELNKSEIDYFRNLRAISDDKQQEVKKAALKRLQRSKSYRQSHAKEFEAYQYLSKWLHIAIREMVSFPGFKWNAKWIHSKLSFKSEIREVEASMKFLVANDFVKLNEQSLATLTQKNVACRDGIYQLAISDYHREMLGLAVEAVDRFTRESRALSSYTFAVAQKDYLKIREILDEARNKLKELEKAQTHTDAVYHVSFTAFPLVTGLEAEEVAESVEDLKKDKPE